MVQRCRGKIAKIRDYIPEIYINLEYHILDICKLPDTIL